MFKFAAATIFVVSPIAALAAALTAGPLAAFLVLVALPAATLGGVLVRLLLTRSGRSQIEALQGRRDGLRESLR